MWCGRLFGGEGVWTPPCRRPACPRSRSSSVAGAAWPPTRGGCCACHRHRLSFGMWKRSSATNVGDSPAGPRLNLPTCTSSGSSWGGGIRDAISD
ncbi:hypothetical protein CSUI_008392 [Cystoisospora suis]|uniref:Uncharacterized protein n=1 Tax=Cystoisospora suis TaxID=483139 RepID=A0A2C6KMT4_9APIC|nr:hypothetical protein CSUI_008392 [Cystoisospora suis]